MDTLLRVHDSPVPTQTFFEFFGSSAMAQRKSDARRHRTSTALRTKFIEVLIRFCESSALWLGDTDLAGEMKYRVIHRHVGFDFIDDDSLFVRRSLASDLD